jgi:hypothetical protein
MIEEILINSKIDSVAGSEVFVRKNWVGEMQTSSKIDLKATIRDMRTLRRGTGFRHQNFQHRLDDLQGTNHAIFSIRAPYKPNRDSRDNPNA